MDKPPVGENTHVNHCCTFRLAGRLYGFEIGAVKEVNTQTLFTPIPHAPPVVCGYVNLRGHIFLVLDLRRLLGLEPATLTADSRLIIFKEAAGESYGVLVDRIHDIVSFSSELTESWRPDEQAAFVDATGAVRAGELVTGVAKLEGELLVLVDARKLLKVVAKIMEERLG
jgi:chemotaxis signal transduction protein